jgi:uncharacterized protein (DUF1697 family)
MDSCMKKKNSKFIALLRGINVSGHNMIPMADLRLLCEKIGWADTQTYIQSGNVVFSAAGKALDMELQLEKAIERRFKLSIPVVVRAAADWPTIASGNPFRDACLSEPNAVLLALSKARPHPEAVHGLVERAVNGERVVQVGDTLWIHYCKGIAKSKLSPALFDRLVGSPVTARNWRTVLKLQEMCGS